MFPMFPVALCSVIFQLFVYFPMPAHFIHFADFDLALHRRILARAVAIKNDERQAIFVGRFLLLLFNCPSTRTRVSFAAAMAQGGGGYQVIDGTHSQMSRGEDWRIRLVPSAPCVMRWLSARLPTPIYKHSPNTPDVRL